jgi:hypothetical protein
MEYKEMLASQLKVYQGRYATVESFTNTACHFYFLEGYTAL